jgi:glyoxylase-like metal-dependent hydrolase (beta-lactamase superfamily II)
MMSAGVKGAVKGLRTMMTQPDVPCGSADQDARAARDRACAGGLLPPVEQVRPDLWSIPVPWPDSGLGYTLAYLVSGRGTLALVDTGWPTELAWTALEAGIRRTGHHLTEVRHVLVTHAHPDHLGLAAQVREVSGAQVGMHPAETATMRSVDRSAWRKRMSGWLRSRGAPPTEAAEMLDVLAMTAQRHARLAYPDIDIEHGSLPLGAGSTIRAVWTPGHTPGHLCYYDEQRKVLLSGDHVLPRITPHIGLPPGAAGDPLGDYQASLRAVARYDPAEVLPAHEHRFTDLGARVEALLRHHRSRLAEIEHVVVCDPGLSTWAVAAALTWSRGWEQSGGMTRHAAVSETWAHLVHLQGRNRLLRRERSGVDSWLPGPRCAAED